MMTKKPRIVIIGAGMAGLTAANKLYTFPNSQHLFDLTIVEGSSRIGGRINTSQFNGDRIEMGATWIHGIGNSPIHKIAQQINSLNSDQPWECMDGFLEDPVTIAEGGLRLNSSLVDSIYTLFDKLMDFAKGDLHQNDDFFLLAAEAADSCSSEVRKISVGSYLQKGFELYLKSRNENEDKQQNGYFGNWSNNLVQEAIFRIHENIQRTYTSAGDLFNLNYEAEKEYCLFPGEEITIAKGYSSVIESLASVLPSGLIQLGKKVTLIEWQCNGDNDDDGSKPVRLHFADGLVTEADHVIVTVSLGVLKHGIGQDSSLFNPPLPSFKKEAIARVGYGLVNKLFVQVNPETGEKNINHFPFVQLAFHRSDSESKDKKIPWWMRKTASLTPLYNNSNVLLSWFAGKEALELENMSNEEILNGVSATISSFLTPTHDQIIPNFQKSTNGYSRFGENFSGCEFKFKKVLKSEWGKDPLFLGSYSYVEVGSSVDDLDLLAEPLPQNNGGFVGTSKPLQIMFAGEATHRTHYSTTHGAYFSGLREANRLLQHYHFVDGI